MAFFKEKMTGIFCAAIFSIVIGLTGCDMAKTTESTPEQIYSNDNSVDMFIYEEVVYINASDIDWVKIYKTSNSQILLAIQDEQLIPYLRYVEG